MGFRQGAYASIWEIEPISDTNIKLRISTSRKNRESGEYEQDFSGFVNAIGTAAAKKAAGLKKGDRIQLGDVEVTTKYNSDKKITYTNFRVFSFEMATKASAMPAATTEPQPEVGDGEVEDSRLPF